MRTPDGTQTTELDVQVLPCPRGSVTSGNNDTCITCGAGTPNANLPGSVFDA